MQIVCQSSRIVDFVWQNTHNQHNTGGQNPFCVPVNNFHTNPLPYMLRKLFQRIRDVKIFHTYLPLNLQQVFATVNHYSLPCDRIVLEQEDNCIHHVFG